MVAEGAAEIEQFVMRIDLQIRDLDHNMRNTRIAKFNIRTQVRHIIDMYGQIQTYDGWIIETNTIMQFIYTFSGNDSGSGFDGLCLSCNSVFISVTADTAGAVTAHLAHGTIGVIK